MIRFSKNIKQAVKFGVVGVSNNMIYLLFYYGLIFFGVHYIISNTAGFVVSVLNAYIWNSKFVFKKTSKGSVIPLVKTFITYGGTFLLGTTLLYLMVHYIGISEKIAPLINLCITVPINFVIIKYWALK